MSDFLLVRLADDETREFAKEIIAKLPEGAGQIVSVADAAELLTQSDEKLEFIPEPDYGEVGRAARRSWYRNNKPITLRTFIRG